MNIKKTHENLADGVSKQREGIAYATKQNNIQASNRSPYNPNIYSSLQQKIRGKARNQNQFHAGHANIDSGVWHKCV